MNVCVMRGLGVGSNCRMKKVVSKNENENTCRIACET